MGKKAVSTVTIRTWKKLKDSRKDCVGVIGANDLFGKWMAPIPGVEKIPEYWKVDITLPIGMETTWRWVVFDKVTNEITQFESVEERKLVIPERGMYLLAPWNQTEWQLLIEKEEESSNVITCLTLQQLILEKNNNMSCVYQANENGITHSRISQRNLEKSLIDEDHLPSKNNSESTRICMRTSDKPLSERKIISSVDNFGPKNTFRTLQCSNNINKDSSLFEIRENEYVDFTRIGRRISEPSTTKKSLPEFAHDVVAKKENLNLGMIDKKINSCFCFSIKVRMLFLATAVIMFYCGILLLKEK